MFYSWPNYKVAQFLLIYICFRRRETRQSLILNLKQFIHLIDRGNTFICMGDHCMHQCGVMGCPADGRLCPSQLSLAFIREATNWASWWTYPVGPLLEIWACEYIFEYVDNAGLIIRARTSPAVITKTGTICKCDAWIYRECCDPTTSLRLFETLRGDGNEKCCRKRGKKRNVRRMRRERDNAWERGREKFRRRSRCRILKEA